MTATTDPEYFNKQPYEEYSIDFDYTGKLPPGAASLSSATLSAVKWPKGNPTQQTDATGDVLQSTTGTIVSSVKVRGRVIAGTDGYDYLITCRAVTNDGQKLEDDVEMRVREKDADT